VTCAPSPPSEPPARAGAASPPLPPAPLALLGALLGSATAYLALAAGHRSDISVLSRVPVLDLTITITIVGVPVAAALAGWILAGRKPSAVARQALD